MSQLSDWYNVEAEKLKNNIDQWLQNLGHSTNVSETVISRKDENGNIFFTKEFDFGATDSAGKKRVIRLVPPKRDLWPSGGKANVELIIDGESLNLIWFYKGGPGCKITEKIGDKYEESHTHRYSSNIDEEGWYLSDGVKHNPPVKFTKSTLEELLKLKND